LNSDLYSQAKPVYWMDRLMTLRSGIAPPPVHVQIVLSDLCNQDCGFCAYRMSSGLSNELFPQGKRKNPNRMISAEKAREIIDDCAALGVKAIQFTGGGEPTVHPDHLELFARAQAHGMATALVTNGMALDASHPAVRAMSWVRVSVDAGTAETYSKTRRVSAKHWPTVWENIAELSRSCQGTVGVGYVVTKENFEELPLASELAQKSGAANIRVGAVFSADGVGYYGDKLDAIREVLKESRARFGGFFADVFDRRIEDLEAGSPIEHLCGYQHLTTYIGGDLGVYRCCNTAYTQAGKVADLHDMRLVDLYNKPAEEFDATGCRYCQFRGQNQVIAATQRLPTHAEFV
jgi:wyosine [tRNA(Phe)-imidazoG37] synthetase (radical SAM superfamily)